jgi:hypothetical protein
LINFPKEHLGNLGCFFISILTYSRYQVNEVQNLRRNPDTKRLLSCSLFPAVISAGAKFSAKSAYILAIFIVYLLNLYKFYNYVYIMQAITCICKQVLA